MKNKIIGLVGEDPNDTDAIANLLKQKFNDQISYVKLIKNKRGDQLENKIARNNLKKECTTRKPNIIIFIRDADGISSEIIKIEKCQNWHKRIASEINHENILLINTYELEALIFADIDAFNKKYKTKIKGNRDVAFIKEPKEELIRATRLLQKKFVVSDCPEVFKEMNIDIVMKNCKYFKDFVTEFETLLKTA